MGFSSWLTSDTEESIQNKYSPKVRPVYLLQPEGNHILEESYNGYGDFGEVNAFIWLAKKNADVVGIKNHEYLSDIELLQLGVDMNYGMVCRDNETGDIWHIHQHNELLIPGKYFHGPWAETVPDLGLSLSDLVKSGQFEIVDIKKIKKLQYPLKFSFDENQKYEDLPEAKICPHQGCFFEEV